jgi:hypothetical protein
MLRRFLCTIALALGFALPASATTFSVDYTDLWYNPAEDGWGINLIQQNNIIFATLFVYGSDQSARWYVASDLEGTSTTFSGALYQTTGPYFGAPWTTKGPVTQVGTMTLTFGSNTTATLSYTVNGVTVVKSIQRQTWKFDNLAGNYLGGLVANATGCTNSANNGGILIFGSSLAVSQNTSSNAMTMTVGFFSSGGVASSCTFNGTYSQAGKLGTYTGTWGCTIGGSAYNNGNFTMSEVSNTQRGINARFQGSDNLGCTYNGNFGGIRDVQ